MPKLLLLIGNIYKTKFVCSLFVGIRFCRPDCLVLFVSSISHSHVFSLRVDEKDLSPAALVAEFTRSLHRVMISLINTFRLQKDAWSWLKCHSVLHQHLKDSQLNIQYSNINMLSVICSKKRQLRRIILAIKALNYKRLHPWIHVETCLLAWLKRLSIAWTIRSSGRVCTRKPSKN